MRLTLYILLLFSCSAAWAQYLPVGVSKSAWYADGKPIVKGDSISLDKIVKIDSGGHLLFKYHDWPIVLRRGTHSLDSVFREKQQSPWFARHDSVYTALINARVNNCLHLPKQDLNAYALPKNENNLTITENGTVLLKWDAWPGYKAEYYVVFSNPFEELLHVTSTPATELRVNLRRFKGEFAVLYWVITKNCKRSKTMHFRLK